MRTITGKLMVKSCRRHVIKELVHAFSCLYHVVGALKNFGEYQGRTMGDKSETHGNKI